MKEILLIIICIVTLYSSLRLFRMNIENEQAKEDEE